MEAFKTALADVHDPAKHYDEYYFRFLKARDFDPEKAAAMFRNMVVRSAALCGASVLCLTSRESTQKWKKDYGVDDVIQNFPNHHEFKSLRAYWPGSAHRRCNRRATQRLSSYVVFPLAAVTGIAKEGGYVFVERVGQVDPKSLFGHVSNEALLKFHIWTVEGHEALRFEHFKKQGYSCPVTIVQDAKGLGLRHAYGPAIDFIGKMSKIDNDNYPEMMHKLYAINTPAIFGTLFSLLKPLIDPVTISKVEVLGYNYLARLTDQVSADQLPTIIGGTKEMHFNLAGEFESEHVPSASIFYSPAQILSIVVCSLKKDGTSINVPSGEKLRVKLTAKAGTVFRYHFKTEGYNIGFGVLQSTDASGAAKERWVIPSKKFESQLEPVADTVLAEFEGEYTFEFDNSFSRFRSKDLLYKVTVESTPEDQLSTEFIEKASRAPSEKRKKDKDSSSSRSSSAKSSEKLKRKKTSPATLTTDGAESAESSPAPSPKESPRTPKSPSERKKKKKEGKEQLIDEKSAELQPSAQSPEDSVAGSTSTESS